MWELFTSSLFTSLVTLDNVSCGIAFTFNYVKNKIWPSSSSQGGIITPGKNTPGKDTPGEDLIHTYSTVYIVANTFDRYLYYGCVHLLFKTAISVHLIHEQSMFAFLIAIHAPWVFNDFVYPIIKPFFETLNRERIRCAYFILYKQIKSMLQRASLLPQKISMHPSEISMETMDLFLKHYFIITMLVWLREQYYFFYKFFKYCYLYQYQYKLDALTPTIAQNTVHDVIITRQWEKVADPRVVHSLVSIALYEKYFTKQKIYLTYKCIQYFCVVTFVELLGWVALPTLIYLYEMYHHPWQLQLKKIPWIIVATYWIYMDIPWFWIPCFIAMMNHRWIDNFFTRTLADFIIQRSGYGGDDLPEVQGWVHVK
jgi:hypothetical protein